MARPKSVNTEQVKKDEDDEFVSDLIKDLNKEHQSHIAWNLSTDVSPTHIKRWVSTGSKQLDYIIANRRNGGLPEGRIIEIYGPASIGKSHIAIQVARTTQQMGGIVIYIDTENATNPENLAQLGVDVSKKFIYADPSCVEEVFTLIESTITKMRASKKEMPVTIIWDSLAATPAKAELEADYSKEFMGLQARALGKSFRKITQVIGNNNILLLVLNQTREKIGVIYGDNLTTPGGNALRFYASVRIALTGGSKIINEKTEELIGINVVASIVKNKVARPFRKARFQIHFGKGIVEHEELFDILREYCDDSLKDNGSQPVMPDGRIIELSGVGAWKLIKITDASGKELVNKKFYKADFGNMMNDPVYKKHIDDLLEYVMVATPSSSASTEISETTDEAEVD
jgi:protein RecA